MNSTALTQVIKKLYKLRLDALFLNAQPNITYLSGFPSRDSYLLITKGNLYFITDSRYEEEAKRFFNRFKVIIIEENIFKTLASLLAETRVRRLGFEAKSLTVAELNKIRENSPHLDFLPTYDVIETFRQIKNKGEIEKIKRAISRTGQCIRKIGYFLNNGRKEIEVESAIESYVRDAQTRKMAFETIVAFGRNASMPHHLSAGTKLKSGEPVLVDMGVDFEGYNSDITRVFKRNCKEREFLKVYDIVLKAQELGIAQIRPDIPIKRLDYKVRSFIRDKGYAKFFKHSLGHGIGLQVHESPDISSKNNARLMPGMVFTVEPAIYLRGKFGVRIEDMVLVTEEGCRVLSHGIKK